MLAAAVLVLLVGTVTSSSSPGYALDPTWQPKLPVGGGSYSGVAVGDTRQWVSKTVIYVTQRGNTSIAPVLVLDTSSGVVVSSWGQTDVAQQKGTWGAHGIAIESCNYPCSSDDPNPENQFMRVYIEDFFQHTVTAFDSAGQ